MLCDPFQRFHLLSISRHQLYISEAQQPKYSLPRFYFGHLVLISAPVLIFSHIPLRTFSSFHLYLISVSQNIYIYLLLLILLFPNQVVVFHYIPQSFPFSLQSFYISLSQIPFHCLKYRHIVFTSESICFLFFRNNFKSFMNRRGIGFEFFPAKFMPYLFLFQHQA